MTTDWLVSAAILAALGSGLIGGVFFAFSTFVMAALAQLPPPQGIATMQFVNIKVINPLFLGVFLGTALLSLVLLIAALTHWQQATALYLLLGALLYLVGTLFVTIAFNIPRNNALAAVAPESEEGARLWKRYLREWTLWNHVRGAAALLAAAAFILAVRGSF